MKCMKTQKPNYKGHTIIFFETVSIEYEEQKKTDWRVGAAIYFQIHIQVMVFSMAQHEDCHRKFYLHRLNTACEDVM